MSLLGACAAPASILVEVDAPALPGGTLDQLRLQVDGAAGSMADTTVDLPPSWPQTMAVRAGAAGSHGEVTIRVTGLSGGTARIRRVVTARFAGSGQVRVRVTLSSECLDHLCVDPFTDCVAGSCAGMADSGVDSGMDGGVDSGSDSGTDSGVDSGTDAAPDAPMDSGTDATMDSGADSGVDSGFDAGCVPSGLEVCDGVDSDCDGTIDDGLPCPGAIVICEVATGSGGTGTDEFVEIYNRMDFPISLDGVVLQYRSSSGTSWSTRVAYEPTDQIAAHGFFLAASANYARGVTPDATTRWSSTRGLANGGGHVRIQSGGTELDRFGWGTAAMPEGMVFPDSADNAGSYERKAIASSTALSMQSGGADVSRGNGQDTDDNSMDFVRRATADPQNRTSAAETP